MKFMTSSGSMYEIESGRVRRVNPGHEKRADGEWVTLVNDPAIRVGEQAYLVTESLRRYGSDDYGTSDDEASPHSIRVTTPVTYISDDKEN